MMKEKIEAIEAELCAILDVMVYLPVKQELIGCGGGEPTYSLGFRKEQFKREIHRLLQKLVEKEE